ncbi:MAG: hypothetical protein ABI036_05245 [Fibrobacteria bacterium]
MKPHPLIPFTLIVLAWAVLAACRKAPAANGEALASGGQARLEGSVAGIRLQGAFANPDTLVRTFVEAVLADSGRKSYACLPSLAEYQVIYPHMPDADSNPESPRMIANMLTASNQKELPRWIRDAHGFRGFSRYQAGPIESHDGYELITSIRVFILDDQGREREFPIFRTLIRIDGGYKIWLLLET